MKYTTTILLLSMTLTPNTYAKDIIYCNSTNVNYANTNTFSDNRTEIIINGVNASYRAFAPTKYRVYDHTFNYYGINSPINALSITPSLSKGSKRFNVEIYTNNTIHFSIKMSCKSNNHKSVRKIMQNVDLK